MGSLSRAGCPRKSRNSVQPIDALTRDFLEIDAVSELEPSFGQENARIYSCLDILVVFNPLNFVGIFGTLQHLLVRRPERSPLGLLPA